MASSVDQSSSTDWILPSMPPYAHQPGIQFVGTEWILPSMPPYIHVYVHVRLGLLDLPLEIQLLIYQYCFLDHVVWAKSSWQPVKHSAGLLQTCHHIRNEATKYMFAGATLGLNISRSNNRQGLVPYDHFLLNGASYDQICATPQEYLHRFEKIVLRVPRPSDQHMVDHWYAVWPVIYRISLAILPFQTLSIKLCVGRLSTILMDKIPRFHDRPGKMPWLRRTIYYDLEGVIQAPELYTSSAYKAKARQRIKRFREVQNRAQLQWENILTIIEELQNTTRQKLSRNVTQWKSGTRTVRVSNARTLEEIINRARTIANDDDTGPDMWFHCYGRGGALIYHPE
ncbi:uncharacterized protein LTR77_007737 [Saxophila tyrrhenica]|uniref:Uncharacterized protein n=1 Tax=Saxophila tyrrhenica TaxID=1690608 RepID=A0AAV9P6Y7_9PEZI|nr:hypothetical protein LTR77_007737 [Saxophila tyrrhenica]